MAAKRKTTRRRVTRMDAAKELDVSRVTIERLVSAGRLRRVGRRGRAHLYDLTELRRLAQELAPGREAAADIVTRDYASQARDFSDRRNALLEKWVADDAWTPLWRRLVETVSRVTAAAIPELARALGRLTSGEARRLDAIPSRRETTRRLVRAAELRSMLDGPQSSWPWPAAAEPGLRRLAQRGVGIWLSEHGGHTPEGHHPPPPSSTFDPILFVRPMLERIAVEIHPTLELLAREFATPSLTTVPPEPADVDDARRQWRAARTEYREQRVAVRREHHRRADVAKAIHDVLREHMAQWWSWRGEAASLAGDEAAVRTSAERRRDAALRDLGTLDGLLEAPTHSIQAASAAAKTKTKRHVSAKGRKK